MMEICTVGWPTDISTTNRMRRRRLCGRCLFYKARIADQSGFARRFIEVPVCFLVILGVVQHNPTTRCRAFYPVRLGFTA
jgi:hypothetical protein